MANKDFMDPELTEEEKEKLSLQTRMIIWKDYWQLLIMQQMIQRRSRSFVTNGSISPSAFIR